MAAALTLGASAVQVGTALLRSPEVAIDPGWAASLADLAPERTVTTRAHSGRLGRAVPTPYVLAWQEPDAPPPARHPHQCDMVHRWRQDFPGSGLDRVNHWAGRSAALARAESAGEVVTRPCCAPGTTAGHDHRRFQAAPAVSAGQEAEAEGFEPPTR